MSNQKHIRLTLYICLVFMMLLGSNLELAGQHSVAREWNELLLEGIRNDYARPTVHARNLHHVSIAMYDSWAAYETEAFPYFLGDSLRGYVCPFNGILTPSNIDSAQEVSISYAAYRLLYHRFSNSPGSATSLHQFDSLFLHLGLDSAIATVDYSTGSPAALGNYIAQQLIAFGLQDSSNEQGSYENQHYTARNANLLPALPGNPNITAPNLWQPLALDTFVDQSGNILANNAPDFLGPEWGEVVPFALHDSNLTINSRSGNDYWVYHDPGPPALIDTTGLDTMSAEYKWGFSMVAIWSSHLDSTDTTMIDISPGSKGNIQNYPQNITDLRDFYNYIEGGDTSIGHTLNPYTGAPYIPELVSRADYGRVLAEFWADGPDSETPPGHWFTLLNHVNDDPALNKNYQGTGPVLDNLEWDVKSYFMLSGAMHDAAITAWGIKGWYDYIRPISAIRYMADKGQCTDTNGTSYNKNGIPLVNGYIEVVLNGDPLAGAGNVNVGKIKLLAWRGPDYIANPAIDAAGVDWILAENWWPYQRPSFVTPPFAGYVSGHSTYSRAAAEVLTMLTGDPFFPGGIAKFLAPKNDFLVFEEGPSENVELQWATYRDASDQCSLSRIWGGIHPPVDDIPGRLIGMKIGIDAFNFADTYFNGKDTLFTTSLITATVCDSYTSPSGKILSISNSYLDTIPNAIGSDSIITIQLEVLESSDSTFTATACDSYNSPSGTYTWTSSGTYNDTITNTVGCDSLLTIILQIDSTSDSTMTMAVCNSYNSPSGNYTWTTSGTYNDTLTNASGCDSLITIILQIDTTSNSTFTTTACDSFTSPSGNYTWTSTGTYSDTIANAVGCDSLITILLTINNSSGSTFTTTACDSFVSPSGNYTWFASNTYNDTIPNTTGCDSLITINLTIDSSSSSTITTTVCDSFTSPSGIYTWTTSGTFNDTVPNAIGCDSVITVNLSIENSSDTTFTAASCSNYLSPSGNYVWTTSGTYNDTIANSAGCDSIITIILQIGSASDSILTTAACYSFISPSGIYTWTTTGTYNDTITNIAGCDSNITVNLTIDTINTDVLQAGNVLHALDSTASYQWFECNTNLTDPGDTNQIFSPTINGVYAVEVKNGSCTDTSLCYFVNTVGLSANVGFKDVIIYPNPSEGLININLENLRNVDLVVYSNLGQLIFQDNNINTSSYQFEIDPIPGVYLVRITTNDSTAHYKLIIE